MRRAVALVVLAAALAGGTLVAPAPAQASPASDEVRMLALTNQLRASVGVGPLSMDPTVSLVARTWSTVMAATGGILHNPDRTGQISGWSKLGENVGMGGSVDVIHQALVESPGHYRNLVDPEFSVVGIGVVHFGNTVYITQNFLEPLGGGHSEPPPAEAEPEPEPVSAPAESTPPPTNPPVAEAPPPAPVPTARTEAAAGPEPLRTIPSMQLSFVLEQLRALGLRP